jgi:uncharacterized phiE125 gp8 family phage protein
MDWTGIKISTAPAIEPVTVTELKTYMRLDGSAYDAMLSGYITAAREAVEKHTGRTFISTVYELYMDSFPAYGGCIELIRPPVQSIASIHYNQASDGVLTLLAPSKYMTDVVSQRPRIQPAYGESWPSARDMINAVKVTYTGGYGASAAAVPETLKICIKALASDLFEHPESNVEVTLNESNAYKFMLNAYTIQGVA